MGLRHKLVMISSDDRIAEVIEETALFMAKFNEPVPFDLVVTPLATGSKEYIEWVKQQTLKKDDSTAFFNEKPPEALKARTKKVGDAETKVEENEAVQTGDNTKTKSLWSGNDPEDDEEDEE